MCSPYPTDQNVENSYGSIPLSYLFGQTIKIASDGWYQHIGPHVVEQLRVRWVRPKAHGTRSAKERRVAHCTWVCERERLWPQTWCGRRIYTARNAFYRQHLHIGIYVKVAFTNGEQNVRVYTQPAENLRKRVCSATVTWRIFFLPCLVVWREDCRAGGRRKGCVRIQTACGWVRVCPYVCAALKIHFP